MSEGFYVNASEVRKNWSMTLDSVVHERPAFISRTHDYVAMLDSNLLIEVFKDYKYHVELDKEQDGSITAYVKELGLVENAKTKEELLPQVADSMKDYALDFYNDFNYWAKAPNRAPQIPYVLKLLVCDNERIIGDMVCRDGKN